jgi:hypothetical protein
VPGYATEGEEEGASALDHFREALGLAGLAFAFLTMQGLAERACDFLTAQSLVGRALAFLTAQGLPTSRRLSPRTAEAHLVRFEDDDFVRVGFPSATSAGDSLRKLEVSNRDA